MATNNPARRNLVFRNLDEITEDVHTLANHGYRAVGNWDLQQACGHIGNWVGYPMDGFPKAILPVRLMLWAMKVTVGRKQLKTVLESGTMKEGMPTMPESVPAPNGEADLAAAKEFEETIQRLKSYNGPWHPSPLFGEMDKETVTQLTLVHSAHHLSFLIPNSEH